MKNSTFKLTFLVIILGLVFNLPTKAQTAVVDSVSAVIGITNTTAFTGSWISDFGGDGYLLERGVCYGTSENPTIDDNVVPSFKSSPAVAYEPAYLEGLLPNTTYYVRAYATNSVGTSYSPQKSFTTANNAEVMWQLAKSTGFDPAITGGITAEPMSLADSTKINGWDKNNGKDISIGSDYLKIYPQGDKPHGESYVDSVYFGFKVAPMANVNFTVKKINMVASGYKTGGATLAFAYSLDGFATQDSLGIATLDDKDLTQRSGTVANPIKPGSGSLDNEFANIGQMYISFSTDIEVPAGKTLAIRMWAWGKNGLTMLMKDVIISGEASTSLGDGSAVVDSVSTFTSITNTTAFTGSWMSGFGNDGYVLERGVCYSTSENPTIVNNRVPSFKSSPAVAYEPAYLEGLKPNTMYYVRGYAIDAGGVIYSPQTSFTTTNNNAEVLWQLSGFRQFDPIVTGDITAEPMATADSTKINGWDKNNGKSISIGSDYLKIYPQGDKPHGESYDPDSYFSFNIKPKSEDGFTLKKFNMVASGYKTGGATLAFAYSLDGFATQDSLGIAILDDKDLTQSRGTLANPIKPGSGSLDDEFANIGQMYISFSTDIEVPAGDSLSIRMWAWGKNGLTMLMKDVVISGETSTGTTDIKADIAAPSFKVYPTMASHTIHVESASRIDAIKIVSINGSVMRLVNPNAYSHNLDITNFNNGLYLVVVKTETGTGVRKVIINR